MTQVNLVDPTTHIGFTGARLMKHIDPARILHARHHFDKLFQTGEPIVFHHGDCLGADAWAHRLVTINAPKGSLIEIHPPSNSRNRACAPVRTRCTG